LARAFNTTADFWLNLQKNHDLWQAEHRSNDWQRVKPLSPQLIHSHL
jgi:plasmid maintenance system antidote protein VapI